MHAVRHAMHAAMLLYLICALLGTWGGWALQ